MPDARELGRWAGRVMRGKNSRVLAGALACLVIAILFVVVMSADRGRQAVSEPKPAQEEIDKAEAERRQEAEREREVQRQREIEQQQEFERLREASREKDRRTVKVCVSIVRQQSDARTYKGFSSFDGYLTGEYGETFRYFGTAEERFQFEKCLAEHGIALEKKAESAKKP